MMIYGHKSVLGYLNFIGLTLLYLILVLTCMVNKSRGEAVDFEVILSVSSIIYATQNTSNLVLPYESRRLKTFYIKPAYIVRHVIWSLVVGYASSLIIVSFVLLGLSLLGYLSWSVFAVTCLTILVILLSLSLTGLISMISRGTHLVLLWSIYSHHTVLSYLLLIVNMSVILVNFFKKITASKQVFGGLRLSINPTGIKESITWSFLQLLWRNSGLTLFVGLSLALLSYVGQSVLLGWKIDGFITPIIFLPLSTYIVLLEALVGRRPEDVDLDLALIRLQTLNKPISSWQGFRASNLYLTSHIFTALQVMGLLGLIPFIWNGYLRLFVTNACLVLTTYFIAYVYYRKVSQLIRHHSSYLRWSFLFLYFIVTLLIVVVGGA